MTSIVSGGYGVFDYDPYGRLLSTTGGVGGDKSYSYDGDHLAGEFAVANNGPLGRYVFGPNGDEPLIWYQGGDLSTPHWLYADEKGSVIATADASGTVLAIDSYNEYGINGAAHYGAFGYTGQRWIPEAGLYDYKARMYSPTLGRFMQTDPIGYGDGINIYNYVGSDPINGSDPTGTASCAAPTGSHIAKCVPEDPSNRGDGGGGKASGSGRAGGGGGVKITRTYIAACLPCGAIATTYGYFGSGLGIGLRLGGGDSNWVGSPQNDDIVAVGQLNGIQTYGNNPRVGRTVQPWYPNGRINTDLPGGFTGAWNDLDRIAQLNGIAPPSKMTPLSAVANGWVPSENTRSGYAILTHASGLEIRFNGANLDTRITIPVGMLIGPNLPSTYLPETIHYSGQ